MEAIRLARGGIVTNNENNTETVYDAMDSGYSLTQFLT